ncbi:NUDIX domain-containing protein [Micromonospora sp. STR1_7]|uniref:NUDIX domain-containing protein n=1 Tax=Micromonospora parastrephiae TaxID=2806101 RepID=A0ABS1Y1E0_9ACTN|nr:NUDIX domain-containing protein [Micromonospora parastrephiae]MBM0235336.1 NUDIX domain-containing protein [Micromonospora parastrephiae]
MELVRRVGVYGVLRDSGRVLVVREGRGPEVWALPGGLVAHAEHPARAVVRAVAEQTGLSVTVGRLRAVVADVTTLAEDDVSLHTDRLLFELTVHGGPLGDTGGAQARWVTPEEAARLPLAPFSAELLGLPVTPLPAGAHASAEPISPPHPTRRLRFGAYGLVTDPAGRILLTQIADGYPGAGKWHLPGGGTDHGEQPTTGLLRELVEEGGQLGRVVELLGVDNLHNPAALGPEGRPLDWHGVRVIYRVLVDAPTEAVVTESAGGSTARAGWFTRAETADLPLTGIAASAIRQAGG